MIILGENKGVLERFYLPAKATPVAKLGVAATAATLCFAAVAGPAAAAASIVAIGAAAALSVGFEISQRHAMAIRIAKFSKAIDELEQLAKRLGVPESNVDVSCTCRADSLPLVKTPMILSRFTLEEMMEKRDTMNKAMQEGKSVRLKWSDNFDISKEDFESSVQEIHHVAKMQEVASTTYFGSR